MNKKKLTERLKELLAKLKPMTWKQRIDFIWTYYKDIVFVVCVLAIIPIVLLTSFIGQKEVLFSGMVVNMDMRQNGVTYLTDDLFEKLGGDSKEEYFELQANAFDPYSADTAANYNQAMAAISYVEAGILDYLIADEPAMEWYILQEIYMDLSMVFTAEELAEFGERVIYAQPDDGKPRFPVAIDISQTVFAKDCLDCGDDPAYFSFVGPDAKAQQYRDFWEYLMAWEQTDYHKQMNQK